MRRDYTELMHWAAELQLFQGYLSTEDKQRELKTRGQFDSARNRFVYALLREGQDVNEARQSVIDETDELAALQPEWAHTIEFVRDEVLARLDVDARKSPFRRNAVRWTPAALGVGVIIAYFVIRIVSAVPVDAPVQSRAGIEQRAAALAKTLRYNDWMSTHVRRGSFLKGLIFWPIEPTESELRAAGEFADLTLSGAQLLGEQGLICGAPVIRAGQQLGNAQLKLVGDVAEHLRGTEVRWQEPPAMTVLQSLRRTYPCR